MADWSVATSLPRPQLVADCEYLSPPKADGIGRIDPVCYRFAFVEYEDRRDADEAYHDMHNKRIGRDDILKIEVSSFDSGQFVFNADYF
jgi:hypothetical protein